MASQLVTSEAAQYFHVSLGLPCLWLLRQILSTFLISYSIFDPECSATAKSHLKTIIFFQILSYLIADEAFENLPAVFSVCLILSGTLTAIF